MVSRGGLEPPQIAPHAPQTCASTIPPPRHGGKAYQYILVSSQSHCQFTRVIHIGRPDACPTFRPPAPRRIAPGYFIEKPCATALPTPYRGLLTARPCAVTLLWMTSTQGGGAKFALSEGFFAKPERHFLKKCLAPVQPRALSGSNNASIKFQQFRIRGNPECAHSLHSQKAVNAHSALNTGMAPWRR
jgi:hypothetical protein